MSVSQNDNIIEVQKPRVLLLGEDSLTGIALSKELIQRDFEVYAPQAHPYTEVSTLYTSEELDGYLETFHPNYIFNATVFTGLDANEKNPDIATAINDTLPFMIGRSVCAWMERNVESVCPKLIQLSTAYVFNGLNTYPYTENDTPSPINVYGRTKLNAEQKLLEMGLSGLLIVRSAWLFGHGKDNIVSRIIDIARSEGNVTMAHNCIGSPTYTSDLAFAVVELAERGASGVYHIVNSGRSSLCEFASEAVRISGLSAHIIAHSESDNDVYRPDFSVLDCSKYTAFTGLELRSWAHALREFLYSEEYEGF